MLKIQYEIKIKYEGTNQIGLFLNNRGTKMDILI